MTSSFSAQFPDVLMIVIALGLIIYAGYLIVRALNWLLDKMIEDINQSIDREIALMNMRESRHKGKPPVAMDGITKAIQNIAPNDPEAEQKREFFDGLRKFGEMEVWFLPEGSIYHPRNLGHPGYASRTIPPSHEEPAPEGEKRTLH